MLRYFTILCLSFWVVSCSAHDEHYYLTHPKALQLALDQCPSTSPGTLTCQELEQLARRINVYAFEVKTNPQAFGEKILHLQETIAKQEQKMQKGIKLSDVSRSLDENKSELKERLAIVSWLLSPQG